MVDRTIVFDVTDKESGDKIRLSYDAVTKVLTLIEINQEQWDKDKVAVGESAVVKIASSLTGQKHQCNYAVIPVSDA